MTKISVSQQAKMIANEVKNSRKPQTFKMVDGNSQSMIKLIEELAKLNLQAEIVTISGQNQGLYVEPSDNMIDVGEIFPAISSNPLKTNLSKIICEDSSSIEMIEYNSESKELIVYFKSKPEVPYCYFEVPQNEFDHLAYLNEGNGSVGSYVARTIKAKYSINKELAGNPGW